jgi:hypothetical protein
MGPAAMAYVEICKEANASLRRLQAAWVALPKGQRHPVLLSPDELLARATTVGEGRPKRKAGLRRISSA